MKEQLKDKNCIPVQNYKPKASSQAGQCIPAGYSHAHMLKYVNGIICHELCTWFLCFGKFPPQICESCGSTYWRNYETFTAL